MFSLVHGRANFIPPATNIDHVNVLELLSSKESKGIGIFGERHLMGKSLVYVRLALGWKVCKQHLKLQSAAMHLNHLHHCGCFHQYILLTSSLGNTVPSDLNKTL